MERDFLAWLKETVLVEKFSGRDKYARPSYAAPVSYPCRIQRKVKLVRDAQGAEVVSTCQIYLDGGADVGVEDRITLPDGSRPPIVNVAVAKDEKGMPHYVEVQT
ncbi:MAG: hypothetical protein H5U02_00615 [Clostridia bacterium]|nr:hypothetical protein [Clostridia bacterium]